jgi:hypothetical protein
LKATWGLAATRIVVFVHFLVQVQVLAIDVAPEEDRDPIVQGKTEL